MKRIVETERLILREYMAEDISALFPILSDSVTMQFWPQPFTLDQTEAWMTRAFESYKKNGFGRYALTLKDQTLIGDCGYLWKEINGRQEFDLGYILDKKYWGYGYAREAAAACLHYGVEKLGFKRVVATMQTTHTRSRRVAETIGMNFECEFINPKLLPTYLLAYQL